MKGIKDFLRGDFYVKDLGLWKGIGILILYQIIISLGIVAIDIITKSLKIEVSNMAIIGLALAITIIAILGVMLIFKFMEQSIGNRPENIKDDKSNVKNAILMVIGYCLIRRGVLYEIGDKLSDKKIISPLMQAELNKLNPIITIVIVIIMVAIVAPVIEEILFRGIILRGMLNRYEDRNAIIISAILFSLAHLNFLQIPNAFLLGLILAYVFYKTRALWICMILHGIANIGALIPYEVNNPTGKVAVVIALIIAGIIIFIKAFKNIKEYNKLEKISEQAIEYND